MEAQLSMDLDSIIAANKASRRSQQASKGNNNGGRGARGGAGRADRDRPAARNSAPAYNTRQQQPTARSESLTTGSTKISIANLDFGVTEEDLKELFGRTGRIKKVQLFYDRNGKSTGTGHVQYASKEDALAAIKRYNGVQLDGRKMQIEVVVAPTTLSTAQPALRAPAPSSRSNPAPSSRNNNNSNSRGAASGRSSTRTRGGRGGRGARAGSERERAPRAAPKSQEELDRELMEYMGAPAGAEAAAAGAGDAMQMD